MIAERFRQDIDRKRREREDLFARCLDVSFQSNTFYAENGGAWAPVGWSFLGLSKPRLRWHWRLP
jgi:hypothetical protein